MGTVRLLSDVTSQTLVCMLKRMNLKKKLQYNLKIDSSSILFKIFEQNNVIFRFVLIKRNQYINGFS